MFRDREEAGALLARKLKKAFKGKNIIVVALTRGGVVVGKVISKILKLPLDIMVVKKIGVPSNPELAIGAVAPKGTTYWNNDLILKFGISKEDKEILKDIKERARKEQEEILRGKIPFDYKSKTVFLVDDGIATGATVLAARKFLKKENSEKVILAVPVISTDTLRDVKKYFDMVVTLKSKKDFMAVGEFYEYFPQITNEEVVQLIN